LKNLTKQLGENKTLHSLYLTRMPENPDTKTFMAELIKQNTIIESISAPIIPGYITDNDHALISCLEHNTSLKSIKDYSRDLSIGENNNYALADWKRRV
jgi:hypothetical protein